MSADDDLPDLPELPSDARAALGDARTLVDPGEAVRARMRSRLLAALPPPPDGGGEDGSGSGGAAATPKAPLWVVAAALAVGGAAGMLVPRAPVERIVVVTAAPSAWSSSSGTASSAVAAAPSLPTIDLRDLPSLPTAAAVDPAAASGAARSGDDLAAERAALDVARTALGRGDGKNALVACDDHARRFPRGALSEEREAIAVQALVLEHRGEDAQARAERFRKTHPRSILLPAVLAAAGLDP